MTKLCQCCSKRYFCKEVDTKEECNKFKSWRETKNYGEVKYIKDMEVTNEIIKGGIQKSRGIFKKI